MAGILLRTFFVAALLAVSAAASALPPRMPPVDYCARDRSFVAFRNALNRAIARRDAAFILSIAADDIEYSFGDSPGRTGFAGVWGLARPATSRLWRELGAALRLGCTPDDGEAFWAPSMSMTGNEDLGEDFTLLMVAVAPGATLRAGPSEASRLVARLRWDVVRLDERDTAGSWIPATLLDGRRGYIRPALFRGFGDYRAVFEKRRGRWRMTAFVAGD
jgi:hypothetical protein